MGFDDPVDPREPARWVAVRHGASAGGNDHIHLVASVVRPDGTRVAGYRDYRRASRACFDIEREHGLRVVDGRTHGFSSNETGYSQGEDLSQRRAHRTGHAQGHGQGPTGRPDPNDLIRHEVHRHVRAAAATAQDEAEFVRRIRGQGLSVRPRYAKGSDDVVQGYSVRLAATGEVDASRWFAGGKLAKDLSLPALREAHGWSSTPEAASAAAAEWQAAGRGLAQASPGREVRPPQDADWRAWHNRAGQLVTDLASGEGNPAAWSVAAREASGALAAWSLRDEGPGGGPLSNAARTLARSASRAGRPQMPRASEGPVVNLGDVAVLMAAAPSKKARATEAAILAQIMQLGQAVHQAHHAAGRAREAERILTDVRHGLGQVAGALPAIRSLTDYDAHVRDRRRPNTPESPPAPASKRGGYKPAPPTQPSADRFARRTDTEAENEQRRRPRTGQANPHHQKGRTR